MENRVAKTLDEMLAEMKYARDHAAAYTGNMAEMINDILQSIRWYSNWYLLRSSIAPIPYVQSGRAFLFTNPALAQAALQNVAAEQGIGENLLEAYKYPLYEENIFSLLARHGVEKVCINKGQNALTIALDKFVNEPDANPFTTAVDALVFTASNEDRYQAAEAVFNQKLSSCQLYYATCGEEIPAIEQYYVDGLAQDVFYLFTDLTELRHQYPRNGAKVECKRAYQIFKSLPGAIFILNPMSSNIIIGEESVRACIELWESFTNVYIAVKHNVEDKDTAIKYAKEIVKSKKVCHEYMRCIALDEPGYPEENPIRSAAGYTAEMINDVTDSTSMEMTYAILAAVFDEPHDNVKAAIARAKEKLL